jgi:O-antigen ligase
MFVPAGNGGLPLFARFFKEDVTTLDGRVYLWQALLSNFQVTRWLGSGLQASDRLLANLRVGIAGQGVIGTAPHSLLLGTLYDQGVIGLGLLGAAFFSLGRSLIRGLRQCRGEQRLLYAAALASFISILIQSLGSRDFWIQAAGASFWIVIALPHARCWPENAVSAGHTRSGNAQLWSKSYSILELFSRNRVKNVWKEKCE